MELWIILWHTLQLQSDHLCGFVTQMSCLGQISIYIDHVDEFLCHHFIVLQRLGKSLERNEDLNIVRPSVRSSVRSCLVWQLLLTGLSAVSCPLVYSLVIWFHFPVLLQSEKGIAMQSLCETSCPPGTVQFLYQYEFWNPWSPLIVCFKRTIAVSAGIK